MEPKHIDVVSEGARVVEFYPMCKAILGLALVALCAASSWAEAPELEALTLALDNYAAPSAGPHDLAPLLVSLLARANEESAKVIVRSALRAKKLLVALDADQIRLQKAAKNLSWIDIPEAGHVVTVDQPKAFIEATRSFLSA